MTPAYPAGLSEGVLLPLGAEGPGGWEAVLLRRRPPGPDARLSAGWGGGSCPHGDAGWRRWLPG